MSQGRIPNLTFPPGLTWYEQYIYEVNHHLTNAFEIIHQKRGLLTVFSLEDKSSKDEKKCVLVINPETAKALNLSEQIESDCPWKIHGQVMQHVSEFLAAPH